MNELVQLNKEMLEVLKQGTSKPPRKSAARKAAAKKKAGTKRKTVARKG